MVDYSEEVCVTLPSPNQPPFADAGGPYLGFEGTPIELNGAGSSDPDNDPFSIVGALLEMVYGTQIIHQIPLPYIPGTMTIPV